MGMKWTIAAEGHNGSPAAHWWQTLFVGEDDDGNDRVRFLQMMPPAEDAPGRNADALDVLGGGPLSTLAGGAEPDAFVLEELKEAYGDSLRVPIADHGMLTDPGGTPSLAVDADAMDLPPEGTVLVGVIDDATGFANRRFRLSEHASRYLYFWQQGQIIDTKGPAAVPFGKEYRSRELNAALATGARECEIYRALGMVRPDRRALLQRQTHGTCVTDAAAGCPMGGTMDGVPAEAVRLLGVNLPVDVVEDASGTFLEFFAILGLMRIMDHVDALEARATAQAGKPVSYPVVINFSFGLSSGAPDADHLFARQIDAIHASRKAAGKADITFMVPAGNQRAARTLGRIAGIAAGEAQTVGMRVPLHSAGFTVMEVTCDSGFSGLQADLLAPAALGVPAPSLDLAPGQYATLNHPADPETLMAALYRTKAKLMVMIAPTRPRKDAHFLVAEPGAWQLRLRATGEVTGLRMQLHRGDTPGAQFYRGYQTRLIDRTLPDGRQLVQEMGTLNTLAGARNATIVKAMRGGTRPAPTPYSGLANPDRPVAGRFTWEVAEQSPARPGRIAAGQQSGAVGRIGGTSIAAAFASRKLASGQPLNPDDEAPALV